ncbi:superoxide dismutase [Oscillibacter hominis]|uniref:Superoxide dismutase n=1 Tax=Oscillibacter hominis TaxID=2763056 RepID=A0A7G9B5M2_9FIRM|nr:superoxide dismutase [Oscillibacter hominis]QNL44853.1 superoxide dismutase [Oscillibacter hominis]
MDQYYPFEVTPLPYSYDSMLPCCDSNNLHFHHGQFYANEVYRLNRLVERHRLTHLSLVDLLTQDINLPTAHANRVRDAAGSVYNHQLYFDGLGDAGSASPTGRLTQQLADSYGTVPNFVRLLTEAAQSIPGAGWVWLVTESNGNLHIAITRDNETVDLNFISPIFVLDLWEHAYLPVHQFDIAQYVRSYLSRLNWEKAEQRYAHAQERGQPRQSFFH